MSTSDIRSIARPMGTIPRNSPRCGLRCCIKERVRKQRGTWDIICQNGSGAVLAVQRKYPIFKLGSLPLIRRRYIILRRMEVSGQWAFAARGLLVKAVILAGGLGSRLSEETDRIPKPMVEIGGQPILWHIMKIYARHGITDFI